jgi:hypothetical protein
LTINAQKMARLKWSTIWRTATILNTRAILNNIKVYQKHCANENNYADEIEED